MKTWIAFLRGINVGGNNSLPMKSLLSIMADAGCEDARSYIQSGNVVFRSFESAPDELAGRISDAIQSAHGFRPRLMLMEAQDLRRFAGEVPFPASEVDPRTIHLFFLAQQPQSPDLEALEALKSNGEDFALGEGVFYLFAPSIGRSKLVERIDRCLGVETTARNWRTVTKVLEIASAFQPLD